MNSNSNTLSSCAYPGHQSALSPQTSTFFSPRSNKKHPSSTKSNIPFGISDSLLDSPQKEEHTPTSTGRQLKFDVVNNTPTNFSMLLEKEDFLKQTPEFVFRKLEKSTSVFMNVEITEFTTEINQKDPILEQGQMSMPFQDLIQSIDIPQPLSKVPVKPKKEQYALPKRKNPALIKKKKKSEKTSFGDSSKHLKNSSPEMPLPLTHFTRSNSDVPPTLRSSLHFTLPKENCLGDNKYLNNLRDVQCIDNKASVEKESFGDDQFSSPHMKHKITFDSEDLEDRKDTIEQKSGFVKNLFSEFTNEPSNNNEEVTEGLFKIPEQSENDFFSRIRSSRKIVETGDFEIINPGSIRKLFDFESESSEDAENREQKETCLFDRLNDNEDRLFSIREVEPYQTPTKKIKTSNYSTERFSLFSTIKGKKESTVIKSSNDFMNSTNMSDYSIEGSLSMGKREVTTTVRKDNKTNSKISTYSRFKNDYEILETIGTGNYGTVYKCKNKLDGLIYAIKCTHNSMRGESNNNQALTKAQALAALSALDENPFIVKYYNTWVQNDTLYIVMEHCQNNLKGLRNENVRFSESMVRQIMRDICMGLKHLHNQGIFHLGIKPENILYSKTRKYKIADLGLSKIVPHSVGDVTEGDYRMAAPELLEISRGKDLNLSKADIFSLGATIYELITGTDFSKNIFDLMNIRRENLSKIDNLSYSNSLKSLIKSMMSTNPEKRPSAEELLTNFLQSESDLELRWERKQNRELKKQIKELEDKLGIRRKNSM